MRRFVSSQAIGICLTALVSGSPGTRIVSGAHIQRAKLFINQEICTADRGPSCPLQRCRGGGNPVGLVQTASLRLVGCAKMTLLKKLNRLLLLLLDTASAAAENAAATATSF